MCVCVCMCGCVCVCVCVCSCVWLRLKKLYRFHFIFDTLLISSITVLKSILRFSFRRLGIPMFASLQASTYNFVWITLSRRIHTPTTFSTLIRSILIIFNAWKVRTTMILVMRFSPILLLFCSSYAKLFVSATCSKVFAIYVLNFGEYMLHTQQRSSTIIVKYYVT
jgi:hypothetical protein